MSYTVSIFHQTIGYSIMFGLYIQKPDFNFIECDFPLFCVWMICVVLG